MKTILVAGGAGYIGSHMVALLVKRGYEVVVADNLRTGHWQAVKGARKMYVGDLRDGAFLHQIFTENKIDGVINFAAFSLVGESVTNPLKYYGNNVEGAVSLLSAMQTHGVDKIVFSSTAAAYGEPEKQPIEEGDRTEPTNPYGATKLAIENMLKWCDCAYKIRYVALRYFNAAGSDTEAGIGEDHNPESHLIPLVMKTALGQRDHIGIFGADYPTPDGTCVRDYIHVKDLAEAHLLALEYLERGGSSDVFNLGICAGDHRNGPPDHRQGDQGRCGAPPGRRPLRSDRLQQKGRRGSWLESRSGSGSDHFRRVGVAQRPSQRL